MLAGIVTVYTWIKVHFHATPIIYVCKKSERLLSSPLAVNRDIAVKIVVRCMCVHSCMRVFVRPPGS